MKTLLAKQDIIKSFTKALKHRNSSLSDSLLYFEGTFETQDDNLNTVESNKSTFINWLSIKLSSTEIFSVTTDKCMFCEIGNPVVLINGGQFPRVIKDNSERSKTGLMIKIKDAKITQIKFCYSFVHTENKYVFESKSEIIKQLIKSGLTYEKAFERMNNKENNL